MVNTSLSLSGHDDTTIPTVIENNRASVGIIYSANDINIQTLKGSFRFYNNFVEVRKSCTLLILLMRLQKLIFILYSGHSSHCWG
jgi:hypothetical protein